MYWFYRGCEFATILIAFISIGWFLDSWLQTRPWFIIAFMISGAMGGFIKIHTMVKQWLEKNSQKEESDD